MISFLHLYHFRNYGEENFHFEPTSVLFHGPNGVGKTNLLEAFSLLTPGRGLRGEKLSVLTSQKVPKLSSGIQWSVSLNVQGLDTEVQTLKTSLEKKSDGGERRVHSVQDKSAKSLKDFFPFIRVLWLTPEMDRLFVDSPSVRRRFLDRLIFTYDADHAETVRLYEHMVKERMVLLQKGMLDDAWLSQIENHIINSGIKIEYARQALLDRLQEGQHHLSLLFPKFSSQLVNDSYKKESQDEASFKAFYAERLRWNRSLDQQKGMTTMGPHRTDWIVHHEKKSMPASLCSTGEQKILLLACLLSFMAYYVRNSSSFLCLLLDDVVSHLDLTHRMVLFQEVLSLGKRLDPVSGYVQTFMTGTDSSLFDPIKDDIQVFPLKAVF
jgi:DNA replication and repair protein RecF